MGILKTAVTILFLSITIPSMIFAIPSREQSFSVENMTNSTLSITREVAPSEEYWISPWVRYFVTETDMKVGLFVRSVFTLKSFLPIVVPPGITMDLFRAHLNHVRDIPPLEILRLFHSVFIVTDEAGNVVKTLDSFTEDDFIFDEFGNIILLIQYEGVTK